MKISAILSILTYMVIAAPIGEWNYLGVLRVQKNIDFDTLENSSQVTKGEDATVDAISAAEYGGGGWGYVKNRDVVTVDDLSEAEYGGGGWGDVKKRDVVTVDDLSEAEYGGGGWGDVKKRDAVTVDDLSEAEYGGGGWGDVKEV